MNLAIVFTLKDDQIIVEYVKKLHLIFLLIIAMVSIQSGASIAKSLFPSLGPVSVTFLRVSFAAGLLICCFRPWREKLCRAEVLAVLMYGASLGCMNVLFYLALCRLPLGITVALEFTGPLAVALCSSRKKIDVLWAFLAVLGLAALLPIFGVENATLDPIGVMFALGSGVCWALYILFGKRARSSLSLSAGTLVSWGMLTAAITTLPIFLFVHGLAPLRQIELLPLACFVGLLSSAIPYFLESFTIKSLPLTTFGVLMSLEPVIGALSGFLILQEHLTLLQWAAIGSVIVASIGSVLSAEAESNVKYNS